jgi:hypothetical protein
MIYDPLRDRIIVSGGYRDRTAGDFCGTNYSNGTWALPLSGEPRWTLLASNTPQGTGFSLAYDSRRDRLIRYGGSSSCNTCGGATSQVFTLDLATPGAWTEMVVPPPIGMSPPRARDFHMAVYDSAQDRIIVSQGRTGGCAPDPVSDLWSLNLAGSREWMPFPTTGTIPYSTGVAAGVFDSARNRVVFVGTGATVAQVRLFDLSMQPAAWVDPGLHSPSPPFSTGGAAAYVPWRNEVLIDENGLTRRVEVLAGSSWSAIDSIPHPGARWNFTSAFDPVRREFVVFSGYDFDQQTWAISTGGASGYAQLEW